MPRLQFLATVVTLLASAAGCLPERPRQVGPGTYTIECQRSIGDCYAAANEQCPSGYDVLNSTTKAGPTFVTANQYNAQAFTRTDYELVFRCQ